MITVIIPCYNSETFVKRAVESVLKQTYQDLEIILVDNNSTDGTVDILEEYARKHPQLITVLHEKKKGAPAARNKGLFAAKGEWVQFLDSDDELLPEKLSHQIELTRNGDVDLVVGNCYRMKEGQNEAMKWAKRVIVNNPWKALLESKLGNTCNNLWKRETVLAVGGWNEALTSSQEYDLLFRMLKKNISIRYFETPETIIYVRKNSIARSEDKAKLVEILNNRINLRVAVRDHLASKGELTKELKKTIDAYIRSKLLARKARVPEYVEAKLEELGLQVSLHYTIRQRASRFKNKTAAYIKSRFFAKPSKRL